MESPSARSDLARAALATAALGLALLVATPPSARGWVFLGGSLGLDQRDVRVFDNFGDPESHTNTSPDPDYPGALGAPLAIWKAAVEWGSERHGTGQGDPFNPDGLGSGGADFDFAWQGLAAGIGGTNDNVVSEIAGTSSGVYAYTELPISDGWRIRFYADSAIWHDAPGGPPATPGHKDLQGVATHELGHALGLDHTPVSGATMTPGVAGNGSFMRSLELDDRLGVRALYGVRSANKPHISALFAPDASTLVVAGHDFAPAGNEVWFPDGNPTADGTPLVVGGLFANPTGTQLVCPLPPGARAGDVLVRVPGSGGAALSNAFPFAPGQGSCPPPVNYGTPKTTSIGTQPALVFSGRSSFAVNDAHVGTGGGLPGAVCVLFSGTSAANQPRFGGTIYVGGTLQRHGAQLVDSFGSVDYALPITPGMIGTRRYYQLWMADAGDPSGVALSDGLQLYFCP